MLTPPDTASPFVCTNDTWTSALDRRRWLFFSLVIGSIVALIAAITLDFWRDGLTVIEIAMVVLFALNLPWIVIGFWNALIGYLLLRAPDGLRRVMPLAGQSALPRAITSRNAIVMPICDENPRAVIRGLQTTIASLDATGLGDSFDIFVLSDSRDDRLAAEEKTLIAAWQTRLARAERLTYRRRQRNAGFKAGNVRDFCRRWEIAYDHMIVLDADSVMTGTALLRMVGLMQANPRLGILQTLVVGAPALSPFARVFQFGMRHGMRSFTVGSAWWQGDSGPYWGHNAIVRIAPFLAACRLPRVPGRPPLGGDVLSHDLIEAVLMRRAGYEVRVLPIEDGSFEASPPTLLDFIKRDLRWCHGNMQYLRLIAISGVRRLGRLQMVLAILMYTSAPCWLGFSVLGLTQLLSTQLGWPFAPIIGEPARLYSVAALDGIHLALITTTLSMILAPKLLGLLQALRDRDERRRYGGSRRLLAGAALESVFSALLGPVVATAQTLYIGGLLFGRRIRWASQARDHRTVKLAEAVHQLWPQTALGLVYGACLLVAAPSILIWAAPFLAGLLLAIPFAVITALPSWGRGLAGRGLCATPEEVAPIHELMRMYPWLAAPPSGDRRSPATVAADCRVASQLAGN